MVLTEDIEALQRREEIELEKYKKKIEGGRDLDDISNMSDNTDTSHIQNLINDVDNQEIMFD